MKAALALLMILGIASAATPRFRDYHTRPGDTGRVISTRLFGDATRWGMIQQYNEDLPDNEDDAIQPGRILRIPHAIAFRRADARITHIARVVESRAREEDAWRRAREGQALQVGGRVSTQAQASAEVTFKDDSMVQMRADSLLIIYGESATRTRNVSRAKLAKGALRSRLGALSGRRLSVEAGGAEAELSSGQAVITTTEDGGSAISQHSGRPAEIKREGQRVQLKPGMGARVRRGKISPPKRLPVAPQWMAATPRQLVAPVETGGTLHGRFERVQGAARYRAEVTLDAEGRMLVTQQEIGADQTLVTIGPLPIGDYYVWIATIDGDGLESPRSQALPLRLLPLRFRAPGETRAATATGETPIPPPQQALIGARMLAPPHTRCGLDPKRLAQTTALSSPGRVEVYCQGDDGALFPRAEVEIVPIEASPSGPVTRGRLNPLTLRIHAPRALPQRLAICDGAVLRHLTLDAEGGWRLELPVAADAAPRIWRPLVALSPEGVEDRVGRVEFEVIDPPPPPPIPRRPLMEHTGVYDPRLSGVGAPDERGHQAGFGLAPTLGDAPSLRVYLDAAFQLSDASRLHVGLPMGLDEEGLMEGGDGDSARLGLSYSRWQGIAFGVDASMPLTLSGGGGAARIVPRVDLSWQDPAWAARVRQAIWVGQDIGGLFNSVGLIERLLPWGLSVGLEANALLGQNGLSNQTRSLRLGLPISGRGARAGWRLMPSAPLDDPSALTILVQAQLYWGGSSTQP
ncbi:FecR domain-containing protein, partial [Myxococcota bacterium]|nr:FecR domain-containing protein [Myxococcota bacterium]